MKIELRNIKHAQFASQETHCYDAAVYVDGKKIGTVSNDGHGGADMFHGDRAAFAAAEAWVKANMPAEEYEGMTIHMSMEILCSNLVNDFLTLRDMRRLMKSKVVLREGKDLFTFKVRAGGSMDGAIAQVRKLHPQAVILNGMPEQEALVVYRGKAA